ncbi:peptidase U32 family protein [Paenibacillus sp. FSL H7-0918]|uniref:peptidase U32 family protein n=1 Tax=Paenibacillus sp. FSL H7-0918 TaxID=2921442 RepID=UPI0030FBF8AB
MKISVPYNGDIQLIDELGGYEYISCFFGGSSKEGCGSGRSAAAMPISTRSDIEQAVKRAHMYNKEFNYLMNSSCLGNREYEDEGYRQIVDQMDWAAEIGVDWITLANQLLVDICRRRHPEIKVSLSSFAVVESVERAKYFDSMGVKEITVRENIARDFRLLERIQNSVECDIQVIVNQTCLYECPMQVYHDNVMSHGSSNRGTDNQSFMDYCSVKCTYEKFNDPGNIMKARWIRPEDLAEYEKIGIHRFKLTDRSKSTAWLLQAAKAYHDRQYPGNLADILNIVHTNHRRAAGAVTREKAVFSRQTQQSRQSIRALTLLDVYLDNSKLQGFIDFFKEVDCRSLDCAVCGYCDQFAVEALSFPDPSARTKSLNMLQQLVQDTAERQPKVF